MRALEFCQTTDLIRTINIPVFGEVDVAPASLNDKLMDETGRYISEEACLIDEQIFFYVDDAVMHYDDDDLIKYLEEEVLL